MSTIVVNSIGSLGDLNPFLLIAQKLLRKGHQVRFVTLREYQTQIESFGMEFHAIRPQISPKDPEVIQKFMEPKKGMVLLLEKFITPIRETYEDLEKASRGADLIVSGTLAFAPSLIHERYQVPWVNIGLQAGVFASRYQFPVLPHLAWLRYPPFNSPALTQVLLKAFQFQVDRGSPEWFELRKELGLKKRCNILFDAPLSPQLQLAAYSPFFSGRQVDWPSHRYHTGFIQPQERSENLPPDLTKFLEEGPAPIGFTLGSAAVLIGSRFFDTCLEMLRKTQWRAVLICGDLAPELREKTKDLPHVFVSGPLPYVSIFPRLVSVVHQGGVGTTGEALRAGIPMVIVPFGQDQYDNACKVARMGCGAWHPAKSITPRRLQRLIQQVRSYKSTSRITGKNLENENGQDEAVRLMERLL